MKDDLDYRFYNGKKLILHLKDGTTIQGIYIGHTPAYDNDPEIASIHLRGICDYEIDVPDIDRIDIID